MPNDLIFAEGVLLGRLAKIVAGIAVGVLAVDVVTGWALQGWGVLVAIFGGVVAAALFGMYRHGRIILTPDELRVGTETFVRTDLDSSFGVRTADELNDDERVEVELVGRPSSESTVRMPGGAWGRNITFELLVVFERRSGKKLVLQTRRRDELGRHLRTWLAT